MARYSFTSAVAFTQRAAGYSLTGITNERCLFFLHGEGRNGKSTLVSMLRKVLGDEYAIGMTGESLMLKTGSTHPTELTDLHGARLAVATETEEGRRMAESLVKQLTGGEDKLKARRMHEDFWEFMPTHKLWICGNHKPQIRGTDNAIWDRIRMIPFRVRFDEPDTSLPAKLEAELPGILAWCIRGCLEWQRIGLAEPTAVKAATAGYRSEMDVVGAWIDERCIIDPHATTPIGELYADYKEWCMVSGERHSTKKAFGDSLKERGFEDGRTKSARIRRGIGLLAPDMGDSSPAVAYG